MSSVINSAEGFGLRSQSLLFTTTDSTAWTSSGHINVPSNGTGTQAINATTLNAALATRDATIASLQTRLTNLENTAATKTYVDAADLALSNRITTAQAKANLVDGKANRWNNDSNWTPNANYASGANYANSAGSAADSSKFAGRRWNMGTYWAGEIAASGSNLANVPTVDKYIPHGLGTNLVAAVVTPASDGGQHSIVCSIGGWDATNILVKVRNLNWNTPESCSLSWVAIA
jgi:hypothetical protein